MNTSIWYYLYMIIPIKINRKSIQIIFPTKRDWVFLWQKISRGWADDETWGLNTTIAKFIIPRLIRFKEIAHGYPSNLDSQDEWDEIIDKIIYSLEAFVMEDDDPIEHENKYGKWSQEYQDKLQEGFDLLGKHFMSIWW